MDTKVREDRSSLHRVAFNDSKIEPRMTRMGTKERVNGNPSHRYSAFHFNDSTIQRFNDLTRSE